MSHLIIAAPHVQQKRVDDDTIHGNGLHIVDDGMVALETTTRRVLIFEKCDFKLLLHGAPHKLKIDLCRPEYLICFYKTFSTNLYYNGGAIQITRKFNWEEDEIVTIKVTKDDTRLVRDVFQ